MSRIPFKKMQGAGNDFVVLDFFGSELAAENPDLSSLALLMCPRNFSVGADGLLAVLPEKGADCRMKIFNADGSEAQMCGNGIRCVARLLYENGYISGKEARIATASGLRTVRIASTPAGEFISATVDMGIPQMDAPLIPAAGSGQLIDIPVSVDAGVFSVTAVSTGNPHGVVFVDDVESFPVAEAGAQLERCALWPQKANIDFAEIRPGSIRVRVWERGVGETLACGTGACAVAAAAIASGRGKAPFAIELSGGRLHIDCDSNGHLQMTGPAMHVFDGVFTA